MNPTEHWFRFWKREDRGLCLLVYFLLLAWCFPLFEKPAYFGFMDWDFFVSSFYVARTSLLDYGQFPGLNPWVFSGAPLWADPQMSAFSYFTPFYLLFGEVWGAKLGLVCSYVLSFEMARLLGRKVFTRHSTAVLAGVLYALNSALAGHWLMGHFSFVSYPFFPLLVYFCLQIPEDPWAGAKAGLTAGGMAFMGLHYFVVYSFLFAGLLILVQLGKTKSWREGLRFSFLFLACFFLIASPRFFPMLQTAHDFPRKFSYPFSFGFNLVLRMFFEPTLNIHSVWMEFGYPLLQPRAKLSLTGGEFQAYIGVFVFLLGSFTFFRKWKFFHVGVLLSLWLLVGNVSVWHPTYWLSKLPVFESIWCFFRWRMMLLCCFAFCAAQGYETLLLWAENRNVWMRRGIHCFVLFAVLELFVLLFPTWRQGLNIYKHEKWTQEKVGLPVKNYLQTIYSFGHPQDRVMFSYHLMHAKVKTKVGYEPLYGYVSPKTNILFKGHSAYRGEFLVGGKAVEPSYWSPNRIEFKGLPSKQLMKLNMLPGKGWKLNGEPLFPSYKLFEFKKPFELLVPSSGTVVLSYTPPRLWMGIQMSLVSFCLLFLFGLREKKRRLTS